MKEKYKIISVKELLSLDKLGIPEYQRPYKWTTENVNQLIDDILLFKDKDEYRLGTIVLHKESSEELKIVDGQQRTITLLLTALAISRVKTTEIEEIKHTHSKSDVEGFNPQIKKWSFSSEITQYNIQNNYHEIERRVRDFDKDSILFFFEKCQVVKVVLDNVTEAFQFFDSQNARGKDLEPHDLLKAFHLREMAHYSEQEKRDTIKSWESIDSKSLSYLFSHYLYRIRNWSKSRSARYFTKNDVGVFKGINPDNHCVEPYSKIHQIAHHYTNNYNDAYHRNIDQQEISYPFQIDQVILNGKRFFEMVTHYKAIVDGLRSDHIDNKIISTLDSYEGKNRTGDQYVRNMFNCALLYYVDRFGKTAIDKAIESIFIWAYSLRLNLYSVQVASIDNHALNFEGVEMFKIIREEISYKDVINIKLESISAVNSSKVDDIKNKFIELKYYEGK